jgi:hypothetical protein
VPAAPGGCVDGAGAPGGPGAHDIREYRFMKRSGQWLSPLPRKETGSVCRSRRSREKFPRGGFRRG